MRCVFGHDAVPAHERLLFEGSNATFHRSIGEDYTIRLTDRALYLPVLRASPFRRRRCWRIPSELIGSVSMRPWRWPKLVYAAGLALVVMCLGLTLSEILSTLADVTWRSLIKSSAPAVVVAAFTIALLSMSDNRTELTVTLNDGRRLRFITPADSYNDEKRYDRQVVEKALQACRDAGFSMSQQEDP